MKLLKRPLVVLLGGIASVFILLSLNRSVPGKQPVKADPYLAKLQLGVLYMEQGMQMGKNPMAGIKLIRKLTAEYPERFEAPMYMGSSAMRTGQFEKAASWFKMASKTNNDTVKVYALVNWADALVMGNKNDSAKLVLQQALLINKNKELALNIEQRIKEL